MIEKLSSTLYWLFSDKIVLYLSCIDLLFLGEINKYFSNLILHNDLHWKVLLSKFESFKDVCRILNDEDYSHPGTSKHILYKNILFNFDYSKRSRNYQWNQRVTLDILLG